MAAKQTATIALVDGHYPQFREITGLSFGISIVMYASDITAEQTMQRELDAQRIVTSWNAHDDLLGFAQFVLRGLESGNIKSKPFIDFSNPDAENLDIQSLHSLARAVIAKAGA